uniref:Clip domain-containing protein n=1 Tax=Steinernema glaseri TaxID=37863 RepID=A0A1I7YXE3_9BILA
MARIDRTLLTALLCVALLPQLEAMDLKVFKRGRVEILDETQIKNPREYNFDEDAQKAADFDDAYDELVPHLPRFELVKNGKFAGVTRIPIITRRLPTWSTARPRTSGPYKTWGTPYIIPVTRPPRHFETKVRSEPVKVEQWVPHHMSELKVAKTVKSVTISTTTATTTRATTTRPTTTSTTTRTTTKLSTGPTTTEPTTTPTTTRTATQVPTQTLAVSAENKFAQRFGVNRVVPQTATTQQPSIIINEILAKNKPLNSSSLTHSNQQTVRSNQVVLQPSPRSQATAVRLHSAPQAPSHPVPQTSSAAPTTSTHRPVPLAHPTPSSRQPLPSATHEPSTTPATATVRVTRNPALGPAAPKPPIIHNGDKPYHGPTFNCRILNPVKDGRPHPRTDASCHLLMPGFSADGSCRCTYEVEGRDENGCAIGFLYICKRR